MSQRYDKFTKRAMRVMKLAEVEARNLNHNYIGTEHVLLGLVREGEGGAAAMVLSDLGVELQKIRAAVMHIVGKGDHMVVGEVGITPRTKKVLALAADEAHRLGHEFVGTEHLLLGLIREGEGIAAGVLGSMGVDLAKARTEAVKVLEETQDKPMGFRPGSHWTRAPRSDEDKRPFSSDDESAPPPSGPKNNVVTCRLDDRSLDALDALVEAGIRTTRSDAAAWLISAGIESHRELFERVYATVREIRQLRQEAQTIARQVVSPAPTVLAETMRQLEAVLQAKDEAIDRHDYERAAALRHEETKLRDLLAKLEQQRDQQGKQGDGEPPQSQDDEPPAARV